jgi:hypothetical protein
MPAIKHGERNAGKQRVTECAHLQRGFAQHDKRADKAVGKTDHDAGQQRALGDGFGQEVGDGRQAGDGIFHERQISDRKRGRWLLGVKADPDRAEGDHAALDEQDLVKNSRHSGEVVMAGNQEPAFLHQLFEQGGQIS